MIINNNIIYTDFKVVNNPKANIIITHGLGENSKDYYHLAKYFNQAGYNVLLYDVRGHGKSSGKRGDISNFHFFLDDLFQLVLFLKKINKLKIFLLGHSMGGIIVNSYVVKYSNIDGLIVSSAPTMIDKKYLFYQYPYYFFNFRKIKLNFPKSNNILIDNYNPYSLVYVKPRLMRNILILSIKYLNKNLKKYLFPCLFLHSFQDKIVSYLHSKTLFNKIESKDKKINLYPYYYHNLFNVLEHKIIVSDILEWLDLQILK
ncbi:MAG: alpha/beta fold hydrolase [Candidatus Phytoplasma pyri]